MGMPASNSLIDAARYWRVPMPVTRANGWVIAHPPKGLEKTGSSKSSSHGVAAGVGYEFADDRTGADWIDATLDISIAPDGATASYWRVDALALWRTSTPERAPTGGTRLVVTVADGCPARDGGAQNVSPGGPWSARSLLPKGTPTSALICAYTRPGSFALRHRVRVGPADAAHLAELARAIDLSHTVGTASTCPADVGTATVLAFGYPGGTGAALWQADSGCPFLSNGTIEVGLDSADGLNRFSVAVARLLHR
jgi:hypothetical protein